MEAIMAVIAALAPVAMKAIELFGLLGKVYKEQLTLAETQAEIDKIMKRDADQAKEVWERAGG